MTLFNALVLFIKFSFYVINNIQIIVLLFDIKIELFKCIIISILSKKCLVRKDTRICNLIDSTIFFLN